MNVIRYLHAALICGSLVVMAACSLGTPLGAQSNYEDTASNVVPIPEADQQYSSPTPVDTIVVDRNGTMTESQYMYDPDQGGVVINNYEEVAGPNASVFFPALEVGLLWWGGNWVDHNGYYWNGNRYVNVNDSHWNDNWNHYWHQDWNNKWNQYKRQHPDANRRYQQNGRNFHHEGMNRPEHPPRGSGGHRGGGGRR